MSGGPLLLIATKGASLSLGATEQAMADANGMDDAMLAKLMIGEGGDVLAASNEAFLNDFATMLGNNEQHLQNANW